MENMMKKIAVILIFFVLLLFIACNKDKSGNSSKLTDTNAYTSDAYGISGNRALVNDNAIEAAFTLDYRPLKAEPVNEADTLTAADLSGSSRRSATEFSAQGSVTGGGLRKLSDYKTVYYDPAKEAAKIAEIRAAQDQGARGNIQGSNEPLSVIDWGPRGEFSSSVQRPSIYVLFSQPMIPLASLGEQTSASPFISINPPVKGTFRWYGTSFLSFEGDEPCQSQQTYTITVAANVKSLYGNTISGDKVFTFNTETLKIKSVTPGEEFRIKSNIYFNNDNVPPEAAKKISLLFNYPVQTADINQFLEFTAGTAVRKFTLKQEDRYKITAELADSIPFDTQIKVTLKRNAKSAGGTRGTETDQTYTFRTPGPFSVTGHSRNSGYGRYGNMIEVNFSHNVNESTVRGAISVVPAMTIEKDNIEVYGNTVYIVNLPVQFGDQFRLSISSDIQDIFGRKLNSTYLADIVMPNEPPPVGHVNFPDYRDRVMLEAQFQPRYLIEYENITMNSSYQLGNDNNPFIARDYGSGWSNANLSDIRNYILKPGNVNTKYFKEIDLSPFLNEKGKGFVGFRSNIEMLTREWLYDDIYRQATWSTQSGISIQVTDLGMTVRYGFNKVVVLVTSLSGGKPVEGAVVKLLPNSSVESADRLDSVHSYAQAVTDKNGLAVIKMNASQFISNTASDYYYRYPYVMAEKDGDKAVFNASSHNMWRFSVDTGSPYTAEEIVPLAFMFSDRGLYKPGETVTFRGVDRSKVLGMYAIYKSDYVISLEENSYSSVKIASINNKTTESGSFYGSISIPGDIEPGSYRLVYRRAHGAEEIDEIISSIPITIAFFERLRFQANLSSPPESVILGDDINLTLRASYLSGGSLAGASWESAWYEEMGNFYPAGQENRNFNFGPIRGWDSKRYIGSEEGVLSGQGVGTLTRATGGSKVTGAPYVYSAEARVTDISNQMISASRSVMAHPASFYIGLNRSSSGFVRSGQEFSCNYITVNTAGEKTTDNSLFLRTGEGARQLKVELIREEWRRIQQRGVGGYVNEEYTSTQVVDSEQMINIQNAGGTIKVKPSAAGYHILRVSSKDKDGRIAMTERSFYVSGSGGYWNMNNSDELRLVPDQDIYEPGDTAKILLQSALPEGYYLITVEREGIFTEEVRYIKESVSVLDIPIARNFVPVVYVSISSYSVRSGPPTHEYGESDLDKPKGYYGVTRVNVNPRVKAFSVSVQSDKKTYRPGEEVTMTLTATKDGRPLPEAELTLMAVDRGVLDLINYRVPDPISHFYADYLFPLSVAGGDSRYMLMDPITYNVRDRMGGDSNDSKLEERKDFNPTAVFEPMLITDANGKVTCKFKLPDNLTTYRVTVFGVTGDLFALKESEIAAQNRINVRDVVPRRLRERDTAEAGVLITNLDSSSHTVTVKLDIGAPLADDEDSGLSKVEGQAFVDGAAERRITVKSGENAVVYFDVAAVKKGNITLNFTVNSAVLNEKLVREMIIEHPIIMETVTTTGSVTENAASEGLVLPSFADDGVGSLSLTLDATRLSLLDSAIAYLFRYPYGCLEQRSSAVMPLVVFGEYLDALSINSEVKNPRKAVENEMKSWGQIQLSNGGFPYWPSGNTADFYVSLRIAHIAAIAKSKNIRVPSSLNTAKLVEYLNREYQQIQRYRSNSSDYVYQSYLQAYMLYVGALLGERVDASRLTEILSRDNVDACVLSFAGMTYREIGRINEAASAAQRLRNLIRLSARGADITDTLEKNRWSYYGGNIEQLALTLQFFAQQFPGDDINTRLLYSLLESQRNKQTGYWQSTAATVRVLSAVDALIKAENLANIDVRGTITLGSTELMQGAFKGLGAKPVTKTIDFSDPLLSYLRKDRMQQLNFTRNGRGNIYYTASLSYAIPTELQSFRDEGLGTFLSVHDIITDEELKTSALQTGKTYRARIRVSSTRDRNYLALRVPVPSGAEILDMAFVTTATYEDTDDGEEDNEPSYGYASWLSHQAIYDNEVHYFWNWFNKGETTVSFLFRTARRGVYPTPPVHAECMYEPEIFGRTKGLIYTIE
jgi:uncharacterized protein YfaS (alpha-2-macroglobulin family)